MTWVLAMVLTLSCSAIRAVKCCPGQMTTRSRLQFAHMTTLGCALILESFRVRLPEGGLKEAEVKAGSTIRKDRGVMSP
jgi:hypothetical protein